MLATGERRKQGSAQLGLQLRANELRDVRDEWATGRLKEAACRLGQVDDVSLLTHEDARRRQILEQADVDKLIEVCLAKMGEVVFSDAYDEGQKMSLEEAVAYALEEV